MEPIVNYMEDVEKKLAKELAELFSNMREQRDIMSLHGIEDMYTIQPLGGVSYEPCLSISGPEGRSNYAHIKLPKDEYVIDSFRHHYAISNHPHHGNGYYCIVLTNYGRLINTIPITSSRGPFDSNIVDGSPTYLTKIEILNILPYKFPTWFYNTFTKLNKSLHTFMGGGYTCSNSHSAYPSGESLNKLAFDTTISLQEILKEFYLFAGKWKPHMTERATLDVDTMRQTIIDNAHCIEELKGKEEMLEQQNKSLQAELKQLKEEKANLEKEKARLLPLEKYKYAVIDYMNTHYNANKKWLSQDIEYENLDDVGNEIPIDSSIIDFFKAFHLNKVFMDRWEYDDVIESKEELNEYRIYKKVKGEMVSSGLDNSSIARHVKSIKNTINESKT
jgi:hypothetical protein